jgi:hypothetical protein
MEHDISRIGITRTFFVTLCQSGFNRSVNGNCFNPCAFSAVSIFRVSEEIREYDPTVCVLQHTTRLNAKGRSANLPTSHINQRTRKPVLNNNQRRKVQDRLCMCNVTLRRVRVTFIVVEKQ